jgi:outer membrane biosynthesis protein TonB
MKIILFISIIPLFFYVINILYRRMGKNRKQQQALSQEDAQMIEEIAEDLQKPANNASEKKQSDEPKEEPEKQEPKKEEPKKEAEPKKKRGRPRKTQENPEPKEEKKKEEKKKEKKPRKQTEAQKKWIEECRKYRQDHKVSLQEAMMALSKKKKENKKD